MMPPCAAEFISTPMRRTRSAVCARAASGHTAAVPLSLLKIPKAKKSWSFQSFE
jgi:hypothetical protein